MTKNKRMEPGKYRLNIKKRKKMKKKLKRLNRQLRKREKRNNYNRKTGPIIMVTILTLNLYFRVK